MFIIYGIILFLSLYFICLVVKYSGTEEPEYDLPYFRDKEHIKYPAIIVGYLNNKTIKQEHFIATALDFVCKGYITVERTEDESDYIFTIVKKIEATDLEEKALKIFFNSRFLEIGTKQTLDHFKKIMRNEKKFGNYGKIKRNFSSEIREYFDKKQEIRKITQTTNRKNILLCYFLFLITCYTLIIKEEGFATTNRNIILIMFFSSLAFFLFIGAITFIKSSLLGEGSWEISIIITLFFLNTLFLIYVTNVVIVFFVLAMMGVIILFDDMLQRKKTNLANTYEMIKGLKRYIMDYSNLKEYDIDNIYLWDEYYVYAVALDIINVD